MKEGLKGLKRRLKKVEGKINQAKEGKYMISTLPILMKIVTSHQKGEISDKEYKKYKTRGAIKELLDGLVKKEEKRDNND